ncbi:MAG TPA: trigger factor [Pyrinomonadaceae bacterium]
MKTELVDVSPTRKEINIEIEPDQIRTAYEHISDRYAKGATVPGFRPGHAPKSVVRNRYKSEIKSEVLRELLPEAVNNAILEHSLAAIGEPGVHLDNSEALENLGDEPIKVKVEVEVFPEVQLDKYKGLEAVRRKRPVTDDDVSKMIDGLREASAAMEPVEDRAAEWGDTVAVNVTGKFVDQPDEEDITADDVEVVLGAEGVQPEFTNNLVGAKPDDSRSFLVDYPEDFSAKGLAGKKVQYEAQVTAVRKRVLPEVDDEWARSLGDDFDSVETLKTRIREDLHNRSTTESDHRLRTEVMKKLLAAHRFEVPQTLVEQQTSHRLESIVRDMIGRGIDPRSRDVNWEGAREEIKVQAEEDVRASLLLEQIAEAEEIKVSDEEVEAEIEAISSASRQPKEQVRAALTKDGGERSIAHRLRNRKALDLLIENASVTEEEWSEPKSEEETKEE